MKKNYIYIVIFVVVVLTAVAIWYFRGKFVKIPGTNYKPFDIVNSLRAYYEDRVKNTPNSQLKEQQWVKDWWNGLGESKSKWNDDIEKWLTDYFKPNYSVSYSQAKQLILTNGKANLISDLKANGFEPAGTIAEWLYANPDKY